MINLKKFISITIITTFLTSVFNAFSYANIVTVPIQMDPVLSTALGEITESYKGAISNTIYIIQNVHCNQESQKKVAGIIESLKEKHGKALKTIGIEGASDNIDTSILQNIKNQESKTKIIDFFMSRGDMTGAEMFDIMNPGQVKLIGLENEKLYVKNFISLYNSLSYRSDIDNFYNQTKQILARGKRILYPKILKDLEFMQSEYSDKKISFANYLIVLNEYYKGNDLETSYPNINLFLQSYNMKRNLDDYLIAEEANHLIKILKKDMQATEYKILEDAKSKNPEDYYTILKAYTKKHNIYLTDATFTNLNNYFKYLGISKEIDWINLLEELENFSYNIKKSYLKKGSDAAKLLYCDKYMDLYKEYINNNVSIKGMIKWESNKNRVFKQTEELVDKLAYKNIFKANINKLKEIDNIMHDFYSVAEKRNEYMIQNMLAHLNPKKKEIGIMIIGGFHSEGLTAILRNRGISYNLITPAIRSEIDESLYIKKLKEQAFLDPRLKARLNTTDPINNLSPRDRKNDSLNSFIPRQFLYPVFEYFKENSKLELSSIDTENGKLIIKYKGQKPAIFSLDSEKEYTRQAHIGSKRVRKANVIDAIEQIRGITIPKIFSLTYYLRQPEIKQLSGRFYAPESSSGSYRFKLDPEHKGQPVNSDHQQFVLSLGFGIAKKMRGWTNPKLNQAEIRFTLFDDKTRNVQGASDERTDISVDVQNNQLHIYLSTQFLELIASYSENNRNAIINDLIYFEGLKYYLENKGNGTKKILSRLMQKSESITSQDLRPIHNELNKIFQGELNLDEKRKQFLIYSLEKIHSDNNQTLEEKREEAIHICALVMTSWRLCSFVGENDILQKINPRQRRNQVPEETQEPQQQQPFFTSSRGLEKSKEHPDTAKNLGDWYAASLESDPTDLKEQLKKVFFAIEETKIGEDDDGCGIFLGVNLDVQIFTYGVLEYCSRIVAHDEKIFIIFDKEKMDAFMKNIYNKMGSNKKELQVKILQQESRIVFPFNNLAVLKELKEYKRIQSKYKQSRDLKHEINNFIASNTIKSRKFKVIMDALKYIGLDFNLDVQIFTYKLLEYCDSIRMGDEGIIIDFNRDNMAKFMKVYDSMDERKKELQVDMSRINTNNRIVFPFKNAGFFFLLNDYKETGRTKTEDVMSPIMTALIMQMRGPIDHNILTFIKLCIQHCESINSTKPKKENAYPFISCTFSNKNMGNIEEYFKRNIRGKYNVLFLEGSNGHSLVDFNNLVLEEEVLATIHNNLVLEEEVLPKIQEYLKTVKVYNKKIRSLDQFLNQGKNTINNANMFNVLKTLAADSTLELDVNLINMLYTIMVSCSGYTMRKDNNTIIFNFSNKNAEKLCESMLGEISEESLKRIDKLVVKVMPDTITIKMSSSDSVGRMDGHINRFIEDKKKEEVSDRQKMQGFLLRIIISLMKDSQYVINEQIMNMIAHTLFGCEPRVTKVESDIHGFYNLHFYCPQDRASRFREIALDKLPEELRERFYKNFKLDPAFGSWIFVLPNIPQDTAVLIDQFLKIRHEKEGGQHQVEQERKKQQQEEQRKIEEEKKKRIEQEIKKQEEEKRKKEEEKKRQRQIAEQRKRKQQEAVRIRREEEEKRKREEEERQRQIEEQRKKKKEEERRIYEEEEKRRKWQKIVKGIEAVIGVIKQRAASLPRRAFWENKVDTLEPLTVESSNEAMRNRLDILQKIAKEVQEDVEKIRRREEEEKKRKFEENRKKKEEAQARKRQLEEERRKKEEDRRRREEAEKRRGEEEKKKRFLEEQRKKEETERKRNILAKIEILKQKIAKEVIHLSDAMPWVEYEKESLFITDTEEVLQDRYAVLESKLKAIEEQKRLEREEELRKRQEEEKRKKRERSIQEYLRQQEEERNRQIEEERKKEQEEERRKRLLEKEREGEILAIKNSLVDEISRLRQEALDSARELKNFESWKEKIVKRQSLGINSSQEEIKDRIGLLNRMLESIAIEKVLESEEKEEKRREALARREEEDRMRIWKEQQEKRRREDEALRRKKEEERKRRERERKRREEAMKKRRFVPQVDIQVNRDEDIIKQLRVEILENFRSLPSEWQKVYLKRVQTVVTEKNLKELEKLNNEIKEAHLPLVPTWTRGDQATVEHNDVSPGPEVSNTETEEDGPNVLTGLGDSFPLGEAGGSNILQRMQGSDLGGFGKKSNIQIQENMGIRMSDELHRNTMERQEGRIGDTDNIEAEEEEEEEEEKSGYITQRISSSASSNILRPIRTQSAWFNARFLRIIRGLLQQYPSMVLTEKNVTALYKLCNECSSVITVSGSILNRNKAGVTFVFDNNRRNDLNNLTQDLGIPGVKIDKKKKGRQVKFLNINSENSKLIKEYRTKKGKKVKTNNQDQLDQALLDIILKLTLSTNITVNRDFIDELIMILDSCEGARSINNDSIDCVFHESTVIITSALKQIFTRKGKVSEEVIKAIMHYLELRRKFGKNKYGIFSSSIENGDKFGLLGDQQLIRDSYKMHPINAATVLFGEVISDFKELAGWADVNVLGLFNKDTNRREHVLYAVENKELGRFSADQSVDMQVLFKQNKGLIPENKWKTLVRELGIWAGKEERLIKKERMTLDEAYKYLLENEDKDIDLARKFLRNVVPYYKELMGYLDNPKYYLQEIRDLGSKVIKELNDIFGTDLDAGDLGFGQVHGANILKVYVNKELCNTGAAREQIARDYNISPEDVVIDDDMSKIGYTQNNIKYVVRQFDTTNLFAGVIYDEIEYENGTRDIELKGKPTCEDDEYVENILKTIARPFIRVGAHIEGQTLVFVKAFKEFILGMDKDNEDFSIARNTETIQHMLRAA